MNFFSLDIRFSREQISAGLIEIAVDFYKICIQNETIRFPQNHSRHIVVRFMPLQDFPIERVDKTVMAKKGFQIRL